MILHVRSKDIKLDNVNSELPSLREPPPPMGTRPGVSRIRPRDESTIRTQTGGDFSRVDVRWNMVFTWQAPVMLMSYSTICFLSGLSIFVLTPLYDGREFDGYSKVRALLLEPSRGFSRNLAKNTPATRLPSFTLYPASWAEQCLYGAHIGLIDLSTWMGKGSILSDQPDADTCRFT